MLFPHERKKFPYLASSLLLAGLGSCRMACALPVARISPTPRRDILHSHGPLHILQIIVRREDAGNADEVAPRRGLSIEILNSLEFPVVGAREPAIQTAAPPAMHTYGLNHAVSISRKLVAADGKSAAMLRYF